MHAEAQRTERALLPEVIERHEARRRARHTAWRAHVRTAQAWQAGHERTASAAEARSAAVDLDAGLELRLPAHPRPSIHEVNFHGPARRCEPERLDDG